MIPTERLHEIAESRRISPSWGEVEAMAAELLAARETERELVDVLRRNGFRKCDVPACNCDSWHQVDGYAARFREIDDAVGDHNGKTLLQAVQEVVAERDAARAESAAVGRHRDELLEFNHLDNEAARVAVLSGRENKFRFGAMTTRDAIAEVVLQRDAARAEAKKYHDALVARHGGEPVALLSELDAARAEVERLQPKVCCGKFGEAIPECSTCVPKLRAEVERLAKQRDDLLAAAEPVADALRDIAGSGHGVYLAAYQAAVEAIGYEWAKNPKPPAPRPVGWFRLNGVEFHPVDGTAEERERAVAVLTRALGVKMYPKPAGGA